MADIHLINPMRNPAGGSEHRTIALFELLGEEFLVQVWTEEEPHTAFLGNVPMRRVGPPDKFPRGGNLVFVGTYFSIGGWLQAAQPRRVILIHNLDQPERLRQVYGVLMRMGVPKPEVVYASDAIAASTPDVPGVVHESPIDLNRFSPAEDAPDTFTVGRLSRDVEEKHHPGDRELYKRLAAEGVRVRIMGGTCLGPMPGVEVLPENAERAEEFLRSLNVFFYRTHPAWNEAYGRVVFEAMACGLPVVGEKRHGYSEKLQDRENALLVDGDEAAYQAILGLGDDAQRGRLSQAARQTVETIYGQEYRLTMQEFYGK